jgi:hypothetical protein
MNTLDHLLEEIAYPLMAGNALAPVTALLGFRRTASRGGKFRVYEALRKVMDFLPSLNDAERSEIERLLESFKEEDDALDRERRGALEGVEKVPGHQWDQAPGRVRILLESTSPFLGSRFGAVQDLQIEAGPGGGRISLLPRGDQGLADGFYCGVRAAQEYLRLRGGKGLGAVRFLAVDGQLIGLRCPLRGESLGLGAAVALLSRLLAVPIPKDTAFTGAVDLTGQVQKVGGVPAKVEAAVGKGLRQVFLPKENGSDLPGGLTGRLTVCPVSALHEVVQQLFPMAEWDEGVFQLRSSQVLPDLRPAFWMGDAEIPEDRPRVLMTCVGKSDPFGFPKDSRGRFIRDGREEGPILTICREMRPQKVYLFHTVGPEKENDYAPYAKEVRDLLESLDPDVRVQPVPLPTVLNPTDYHLLIPAFEEECRRLIGEQREEVKYLINLTSGSSQMEVTWVLLTQRGIPPAHLLQVREGRFAHEGGSRVRPVSLPWVG